MATQPLSKSEITHYTNLWCRQQGFNSRDLTEHPCMDQVIFLKQFLKEFGNLPGWAKPTYNKIYRSVYQGQIPLKESQWQALERLAEKLIKWQAKQQQQRQKIQRLKAQQPQ